MQNRTYFSEIWQIILILQFPYVLSLNHGVYIIEKGYKKTVCPDGKYFHQNKLFFIFTLIIFSEHSYFLRKSQITPERKQRKKYFLTPFALHWNIQTARKTFIYGLFRNLVVKGQSLLSCFGAKFLSYRILNSRNSSSPKHSDCQFKNHNNTCLSGF